MRLSWKTPTFEHLRSRHTSGAEHSAIVVMGGYRDDGSVIPARDFFADAIANTDFSLNGGNIHQSFTEINERLHEEIKSSIADDKWRWDRTTYRRNGQVVDSPRDIIDSGELLNSQSWEILP